jgi:periplasmic protein CpxP/Spy
MGMGPGMGMAAEDPGAIAAARLAELKSRLKITPAQETAWKAYEGAITQRVVAMQSLREHFRAEPPADRRSHFEEMSAFHQNAGEAQRKAQADLFAVLTPEQQALAGRGRGPWGGLRH